jgi:hypothetical protein
MRGKCRVYVKDSTLVGKIKDCSLHIGDLEVELRELVKIRNLGGDRRCADLKKGTVLEYRTEEAKGFLDIEIEGAKGVKRIDPSEIKGLESLKKG